MISPARRIAYEVLRRVEAEGAYASDVLHTELGARVKAEDAGLATELVMGVLRWRRLLDFLLERQMKKTVARLDLPVALALRIGLYQLRFLERIPARAAVNESVELVKSARKTSAATLVNAVLRRAADEARVPAAKFVPQATPLAERLGILHSHPTWMVERWLKRLGEAQTVALLEANNRAPRLSCALHDLTRRDEIFAALQHAGLRIEAGHILQSAFSVRGGSPTRTESFRSGAISIQDEASQTVPLLLDTQSGDRVLDLCAAPGGKTPSLVRSAGASGIVVAADRHAHRLRAMREQFKRLGLTQVQLNRAGRGKRAALRHSLQSHSSGRPVLRNRHARAPSGNSLEAQVRTTRGISRTANRTSEVGVAATRAGRAAGLFHVLDGAGRERASGRGGAARQQWVPERRRKRNCPQLVWQARPRLRGRKTVRSRRIFSDDSRRARG